MKKEWQPIEQRICRSLERAGFQGFTVNALGGGDFEIIGTVESRNDQALVMAIARSVAGVKSVTNALRFQTT